MKGLRKHLRTLVNQIDELSTEAAEILEEFDSEEEHDIELLEALEDVTEKITNYQEANGYI